MCPTFVLAYREAFNLNLRASEASKIFNSGIFLYAKVLKYSVKGTKPDRVACSREESNLHGFPHTVLSRTRLPFRHVSVASSGL